VTRSGGGRAAAGGFAYGARVAAYYAVAMLSEEAWSPPWALAQDAGIKHLAVETREPIDDLMLVTTADERALLQIKRAVSLSERPGSPLAAALEQFVRQQSQDGSASSDARYVLVTSGRSSAPILEHLPTMLTRFRLRPMTAVDEVEGSQQERRAWAVVLGHLRRLTGSATEHTQEQLSDLLTRVWIQELSVEAGGIHEQQAQEKLRTQVLHDSAQAASAWSWLIQQALDGAAIGAQLSREALASALERAGFPLRAAPSYAQDIARLQDRTADELLRMKRHSFVPGQSKAHHIARQLEKPLLSLAQKAGFLLIGAPGSGKTGALWRLAEDLRSDGHDLVLLTVGGLSGQQNLDAQLGLEHTLATVLREWSGAETGYLIVDALDAARGETIATALRQVIEATIAQGGRWRVIASIRRFDLRHDHALQEFFPVAVAHDFIDPAEFHSVSHFAVPLLTGEELDTLQSTAPQAHAFLQTATLPLRELARNPFNLGLLLDVLGAAGSEGLHSVTTQLDLLARYWEIRVLEPPEARSAHQRVLTRLCQVSIRHLTLHAPYAEVATDDESEHRTTELLHRGVLDETTGGPLDNPILGFSHHILFDYAVARLLLKQDASAVIELLKENRGFALMARPSLVYALTNLWQSGGDRAAFWDLVWAITDSPQLDGPTKMVAPAVISEEARLKDDLHPVLGELTGDKSAAAHFLLHHTIGALRASTSDPLGDAETQHLWSTIAAELAMRLDNKTEYAVRILLVELSKRHKSIGDAALAPFGSASRRYLAYVLDHDELAIFLRVGIEVVARTAATDLVASETVLRKILDERPLELWGHETLQAFSYMIESLVATMPLLVRDIYIATFTQTDERREPVPMGSGAVLGLSTTPAQNWNMARYGLAKAFPILLATDPELSTAVLVAATMVKAKSSSGVFRVAWQEREVEVIEDLSSIWDSTSAVQDDLWTMLTAYEEQLRALGREHRIDDLQSFLSDLAGSVAPAALWRRVLRAAIQESESLIPLLADLLLSGDILSSSETYHPAAELIRAGGEHLSRTRLREIEEVALALPDGFPSDRRQTGERHRDRILGALANTELQTDAGLQRWREVSESEEGPPANEEPFRIETGWQEIDRDEQWRDQGVDTEAPENADLRRAIASIEALVTTEGGDKPPDAARVSEIFTSAIELFGLVTNDASAAADVLRHNAFGWLLEGCALMARSPELLSVAEAGKFVRERALEAASRESEGGPDVESFDRGPHWGLPNARRAAAATLISLTSQPTLVTETLVHAIAEFSHDASVAVRFTVAEGLARLYAVRPAETWTIIEEIVADEQSAAVISAAIVSLAWLSSKEEDRATKLVAAAYDRERAGLARESLLLAAGQVLIQLWVLRDNQVAHRHILDIADRLLENGKIAERCFFTLRGLATYDEGASAECVRRRALDLWTAVTRNAVNGLSGIVAVGKDVTEQQRAEATIYSAVLRTSAMEIQFTSGAYEIFAKQATKPVEVGPIRHRRFYGEARELFDLLCEVGLPPAADDVLQTLSTYTELDPRGVLLRLGRLIAAGHKWGYTTDGLAESHFMPIVDHYLAAQRALVLQDAESRDALIGMLTAFVEAGWPSALRVLYGMEDMFR